ncbi:NYN domain-containing protein [Nostoc sp.]|uniref:NYN domain-containing protein n=1 Tax=Nostoc sp. TaxID=1180 RepID=UPI002FFC1376
MIDTHIASNRTSHKQLKVLIYWDFQNAKLSLELAKLLLVFAKSIGRLIGKNIYYNSQCEDQAAAKNNLASISYTCFDVPCPLKDSADNQLIADCLKDIHSNLSPDIVILISGDGDFVNLVRNLQKLGKKVIIFAQAGNVKQKLKELADEFYFIDKLPELVDKKTKSQTTSIEFKINYNEAIECFTKAITTTLSQGKHTEFGYIDKLMRQHCVSYQGFSSIHTPDGKKFKSFGKFVDAAVRDGKVQKQGQELFLVELDKLAA